LKKRDKKPLWITEFFTPYERHSHAIKKIIVKKKTKFQKIIVADTFVFGRALFLDDEIQSALKDEFIYHESLVIPAMILSGKAEKILILGGGEGSTLREVYKFREVKEAVMVDIDGEAVSFCYKYLKDWHRGSFDDKRTKLVIEDARKYVFETKEKFDVVISDLPTPIRGGPAFMLYTIEFYKKMKERMNRNSVFICQAGSGAMHEISFHASLFATLRKVFKYVKPYYIYVPSFDVPWSFIIASDYKKPSSLTKDRIKNFIRRKLHNKLKFYDAESHIHMFSLPSHIRNIIFKKNKIITDRAPQFSCKK